MTDANIKGMEEATKDVNTTPTKVLEESLNALFGDVKQELRTKLPPEQGVSISKLEKCTLSKTGGPADVLIWLHKRSEEKGVDMWIGGSRMRASVVSV